MSAESTRDFNNIELYGVVSFAFVIVIIAFVLIVIAITKSDPLFHLNATNSVQAIATANGIAGSIENGAATFSVTTTGLLPVGLLAANDGSLIQADNSLIIGAKLTGFEANTEDAISTEPLTENNTIMDIFQKGCVLHQTEMGNTFTPNLSQISLNETLFNILQKVQGGLDGGYPNWFSNNATFVETNPLQIKEIFSLSPSIGSPLTPPNFWKPGCTAVITSVFNLNTNSLAGVFTVRMKSSNGSSNLHSNDTTLTLLAGRVPGLVIVQVLISYSTSTTLRYQVTMDLSSGTDTVSTFGSGTTVVAALDLSQEINFSLSSFMNGSFTQYVYYTTNANFLYFTPS